MRIEDQQKTIVFDRLALFVEFAELGAVQKHAERTREILLPILARHFLSIGTEPRDIADARAVQRPALKPSPAAKHRVRRLNLNDLTRKFEQRFVDRIPVVPRDLGILAIRVVVAVLRAAEFVTSKNHGDALRK